MAVLLVAVLIITTHALIYSPPIAAIAGEVNELAPIPIIGIAIYVGLISGHIPSPLYERNERWSREYAILQIIFLILTASCLTRKANVMEDKVDDDDEYEYDLNLEELASFTHWLDSTNLHQHFYEGENGIELLTETVGEE